MAKRVRQSVAQLTSKDLASCPVWEFALEKEGELGQDETTVRPHATSGPLDPGTGMFVVRARFRLANGSLFSGYLTPPAAGQQGLETVQPVIVTDNGQVWFYCGRMTPDAGLKETFYGRLRARLPSEVFPVSVESDAPIIGGPVRATVPGFVVLEDFRTGRVRVEQ